MWAVQINTNGRSSDPPVRNPTARRRHGVVKVCKIIESGAEPSVSKVAEHEEIGRKKKKTEEQPTGMG
jgi:hypothetical protein